MIDIQQFKKVLLRQLMLLFSVLSFQQSISQSWVEMAPMPTARHAFGVAVIDDLVYTIGGSTATLNTNLNEVYNTTSNTWQTKAPMPTGRAEVGVATVNGKIYCIGGYNTNATNVNEAYDPATNTWSTMAPMPLARSVISAAVVNNIIYVMGGWPGNITNVEAYNPATNSWSTKSALAFGRQQINGAVGHTNGKLYFMGGKNDWFTQVYNDNVRYDVVSNSWVSQAPVPIGAFASGVAIDPSVAEIHLIGGSIGPYATGYKANFADHYIYNIAFNSWTTGVPLPVKRAAHSTAIVNSRIYVFGGDNEFNTIVGNTYRLNLWVVPIKWKTFNGYQSNKSIVLNWETTREINNKEFIAEHSTDGQNWKLVSTMPTSSNNTGVNKYQVTHIEPAKGDNFYRIRQRDLDGKESLSETIKITFKSSAPNLQLHTNPVLNNKLIINIESAGVITIFDIYGRSVMQQTLNAGIQEINLEKLTAGNYLVQLNNQTIRFIKL